MWVKVANPAEIPVGIPRNFEDFPKLSHFWILVISYYIKSVFFELYILVNSTEQGAVVPHFEFMEVGPIE